MNLEHPFFKGEMRFTIESRKAFWKEWDAAYNAQKDDPAVAALHAALTTAPDGLADTTLYFRGGVGLCCIGAQYEAKVVTERCINAADVPAASPFSAEKVAAIRSDPELLKSYILHIVQLENSIMTLESSFSTFIFTKS